MSARPRSIHSQIIKRVSKATGVPVEDIMSPSRRPEVARPRQVAYWLLSKLNMSSGQIATIFKRDGSTIRYSHKVVEDRRKTDPEFSTWLVRLQKGIHGIRPRYIAHAPKPRGPGNWSESKPKIKAEMPMPLPVKVDPLERSNKRYAKAMAKAGCGCPGCIDSSATMVME